SFDTYSNANDVVGIEVKAFGGALASAAVNLRTDRFAEVAVLLHPNGWLDVIYDGVYAITNAPVGSFPAGSLFGFGARTGGLTDNHFIDDLSITTATAPAAYLEFYYPAGNAVRADSPIAVVLSDWGTTVNPAKIVLQVDGVTVSPLITQSAPDTVVRYVPPAILASGSSHTVSITYADDASPTPATNTWSYGFTVAAYQNLSTTLIASSNLVSSTPGFALRISQIEANRGPSIQRAESQLAGLFINPDTGLPYPNLATITAFNEPSVINYSTTGGQGGFQTEPPLSIPGLPGQFPDTSSSGDTNAALDAVTYLYLQPGLYALGVNSSDGFRLTLASTPDMYAPVQSVFDGVRSPADSVTTFGVSQAGYYPFRICYFIGGLEAVAPTLDVPSLEFFAVDAVGGKTLINDANVAGFIPAFLPAQTLPYVRSVDPIAGSTGVPKNTALEITLINGSITVAPGTAAIELRLNGASVAPTVSYGVTNNGVTTIRYQPPVALALNSSNFVEFAFTDSAANRRTNSYYFITENVLTQLFAIPPASATNATWAKWVSSTATERGLAYNPKTGHVLVVSRGAATGVDGPNGLGVAILDGNTGLYLGQLSIILPDNSSIKDAGIGLFKLNMIDVAEDGVIYACALTTSWNTQNFVVYRWQDENASPTIAVASPQLGGSVRVGDVLVVRGSGAGTEILASGNAQVNMVPLFTTTDGTNFAGTALNVVGLPNASTRLGLAFGCGNTFYGETTGGNFPLRYISFAGAPSTVSALITNYPIVDAANNPFIGPIGVDIPNQRLIGASTAGTAGAAHSMNLFDLDALVAGNTNKPVDSKPFPISSGTFGTGAVDFTPDGTRVYTLDSGSGVIAFSLAPKLAQPAICAHPKTNIVAGPGALGFMDVMAIGAPQSFQWFFNGAPIANATNRTLNIADVQPSKLGFYRVTITNFLGSATSSVAVLDTRMVVTEGMVNQVVAPGGSASFSVTVSNGLPAYAYQWRLNDTNIAGATASTLNIPNAQASDAGAYTVAITDSLGQSIISPMAVLTVGTLGTGTGLAASYFNLVNFAENDPPDPFGSVPALNRIDPTIDFDWGALGSPDPFVFADFFTVRWQGQVQPFYSQTYTFYTRSDDGARLWVDGKLLVNRWVPQAPTEASGTIDLVANQKHSILMEYYEKEGGAVAQLMWSSPGQVKTIVPMTQLYPVAGAFFPSMTSSLSFGTNIVLNWTGTCVLETAPDITGPWTPILTNAGPFTISTEGQPAYFRLLSQQAPL
ncbi:MAG TPA: PA14 domain-containing protein, partial [Clostridia bacterium]|nr:PA14 domain-containing protein [Clostridia bacterium]